MTNDKYRIDNHKLIYHPQRIANWLNGDNIYPIYVEIGPAGQCNCRCVFCSVDYIGYQNRFLKTGMLKERLMELGRLGVKSIMYAGEGEPFLHQDMTNIIINTKEAGIDAALTTNGILMTPGIPEKILGYTEWIKVSCNAGTPGSYAKIHRTKQEDFNRVINNLAHAVQVRKENGYSCTLGIQMLLLPENAEGVEQLAEIARDIGLDYLVIKPYTHHSQNRHKFSVHYEKYVDLEKKLRRFSSDTFSVIFRAQAMRKWDKNERHYEKCLGLSFWCHIDAGGNVWGCGAHLEDERFLYGNINEQSFQDIWEGQKRKKAMARFEQEFDISACRLNCRMDKINQYLWEIKNPIEHVNFI